MFVCKVKVDAAAGVTYSGVDYKRGEEIEMESSVADVWHDAGLVIKQGDHYWPDWVEGAGLKMADGSAPKPPEPKGGPDMRHLSQTGQVSITQ